MRPQRPESLEKVDMSAIRPPPFLLPDVPQIPPDVTHPLKVVLVLDMLRDKLEGVHGSLHSRVRRRPSMPPRRRPPRLHQVELAAVDAVDVDVVLRPKGVALEVVRLVLVLLVVVQGREVVGAAAGIPWGKIQQKMFCFSFG